MAGRNGKAISATSSHGTCPLCDTPGAETFCTGFDRLCPRRENFLYVRCRTCGLVRMDPMPGPDETARFYASDYHPHTKADPERIEKRLARPLNRFIVTHYYGARSRGSGFPRAVARILSRFSMEDSLAPHGECRLLDVGCGSGRWLYRHHRLGWRAEGVELLPEACDRGRSLGLRIAEGDIFVIPPERRDLMSSRFAAFWSMSLTRWKP